MADGRFFEFCGPIPVKEAARIGAASILRRGRGDEIERAASADDGDLAGAVVFVMTREQAAALGDAKPALCLAPPELAQTLEGDFAVAEAGKPRAAFGLICQKLYRSRQSSGRRLDFGAGVAAHETASVDPSAEIGAGAVIGPQVSIGPGVVIGENSQIHAGAVITHAILGRGVRVGANAVIGSAGFGFEPGPSGVVRMPQLGRVLIGDEADIGVSTTIDRGALGDTVIGNQVKIDNLVQIGHNVRIGDFTVIAGQSGISGSCVIGKGVMMGGRVGLTDHVTIGDGAQLAAGTGVMRDIPPGEKWGGAPARPIREWLRETAAIAKLARKSR